MKAVVIHGFADASLAAVGEAPDPAPGPGEVVVDIEVSDTNYPDVLYVEGTYQKQLDFPFVPGLAGAGRISALGDGVDPALSGQRVLVMPDHGTYAEKTAAPACHCMPVPDDVPSQVAAAFGLVYQTAYLALTDRAGMGPGETVLVLGATGGIGMAAVQLAKALGAWRVIAATRGEGAKLARRMGADVTIDAGMDNLRDGLRDAVREATGGHGADVVIDPVGGALSAAALRAMAWRGRLVVVGFASGEIPGFAGNYLLVKNLLVSGIQWTDYRARQIDRVHAAQAHIFALWQEGKLDPMITATLPLEDCAKALVALKTGQANGKIILTIGKGVAP